MMSVAPRQRRIVWVIWLVSALLFLAVGNLPLFGVAVPASAALMVAVAPGLVPTRRGQVDRRDVQVVGLLYGIVVAAMCGAFRVFSTERVLGLFLCFAAALLVGVVGPVVYTVWNRGRPLADLGLRIDNWRPAAALGMLLAGVQFALTLYGTDLPEDPVDWVPLAVMSLMVGLFEAIFFRGFIQTRLAASFGMVPGVGLAAALYALYHVGYGMGWQEMVFLFGLGLVYGIAYACVPNILVLWPLLIPMGSFFNNLESGGFDLPWASILGFLDVLALMAAAVALAHRRERRSRGRALVPSAPDTHVADAR
jgi:membrane protease YdiL (CAAX protease family)